MEAKIKKCDGKMYIILRIGLKHHTQVDKGLDNLFREFEEDSKHSNSLYPDCEEDENYLRRDKTKK
jgi:hypothetical protein